MSWGTPGSFAVTSRSPNGVAPMELPKIIRRVGEQALWSSQNYPDATALASTTARVFTTPRGQIGQGFATALSTAETNLKEGGRIPGGQAYDVFGVACQTYYSNQWPVVRADVANMTNNCVLAWDFLQTQIEIAPSSLVGAGGGPWGDTADTGAADGTGGSRILINNGNGQIWVYRETPVVLAANSTFAMLLIWGVNASAVDGGSNSSSQVIRVLLMGRYQTAIAVG